MSAATVQLELHGQVAVITLNRPHAKNSLRLDDMDLLGAQLQAVTRSAARCLLIRGAGDAFCAGRDLKDADPERDDTHALLVERINPPLKAVHDFGLPTIAAVRGPALGFGFGLALACDMTVVADNALLGSPFRNIGAVLDSGGHYFLRERVGVHRAAELIFTGRLLSGREAAQIGLVNRSVAALRLDAIALDLARTIAAGPTSAFQASKEILHEQRGYDDVLALEAIHQARALAGPDGREGIRAFQDKRRPVFVGQ